MDYQLSFDDDPAFVRLATAWELAISRLEDSMTKPQFLRFIRPLRLKGREENVVLVGTPGQFLLSWVKERFQTRIEEALSDEIGERIEVRLIAEPKPKPIPVSPPTAVVTTPEPRFSDKYT